MHVDIYNKNATSPAKQSASALNQPNKNTHKSIDNNNVTHIPNTKNPYKIVNKMKTINI